jgi:hypothetical protein
MLKTCTQLESPVQQQLQESIMSTNGLTAKWGDVWEQHTWSIVRADRDIAHVMLPLHNFDIEPTSDDGAFKLVRTFQAPEPDCFDSVVFNTLGTEMPTEGDLAALDYKDATTRMKTPLALYSRGNDGDYYTLACKLGGYLNVNPHLLRLEATIRIPCHAYGATPRAGRLQDHAPMNFNVAVQIYVFPDLVQPALGDDQAKKQSLLVVRTPLWPSCPLNGDGTAIGFGRK